MSDDRSHPYRASYVLSRAGTGTSATPSLQTTSATRKWCVRAALPIAGSLLDWIEHGMQAIICAAPTVMFTMGLQTIQRLRMEDRGTAVIDWQLQVCMARRCKLYHCKMCSSSAHAAAFAAQHSQTAVHAAVQGRILRVLDVDARVASKFTMNLLTGRVIQHRCGCCRLPRLVP